MGQNDWIKHRRAVVQVCKRDLGCEWFVNSYSHRFRIGVGKKRFDSTLLVA